MLALCITLIFAAGISIRPGTILLQDAPVGDLYDFYERRMQSIKIGPAEKDIAYNLYPEKASEGGTKATGFYDFPEPEWFILEKETLEVREGEVGEVRMWLEIPAEDGLYNHHWLLGIPVTPISIPGRGAQIQVGAYLLFRIETEAKSGVVPICAPEEIVAVPSKLEFLEILPGEEITKVVTLFQGRDMSGLYTVKRLDPESDVARLTILGTPGFPRLSEPGWIEYPDTVVIPGADEGGGPFPVTVNIPSGAQVRRFEEILMFEKVETRIQTGNETRPAFLRIIVTTKQG